MCQCQPIQVNKKFQTPPDQSNFAMSTIKRCNTDPIKKRPAHLLSFRAYYTIAFEPIVYKRRKNSLTSSTDKITYAVSSIPRKFNKKDDPLCQQVNNDEPIKRQKPAQLQNITKSNKINGESHPQRPLPSISLEPPLPFQAALSISSSSTTHSTPLGPHGSIGSLDKDSLTPIRHFSRGHIKRKLFKELEPAELASVTIGRGAFGRVFSTSLDNINFAIKMCPASPCSCRGEKNSLSLRHPNIVTTHEIIELRPDDLSLFFTDSYLSNFNSVSLFKTTGLQMVIMEAAGSMSLETCISDSNEVIDRERRNYFLYQISSGLAYCHDKRILHLDLKPSNIMISSEDTCKLVDFGCSLNLESGHDHRSRIRSGGQPPPGTIPYTSPELFRGELPTEKADVYSFGIIMWQLVSRETPFLGDSSQVIIFKVCRGVRPKFVDSQRTLEMCNYIRTAKCCWDVDVSTRPSADELVHRFTSDSPDTGYESLTT